MNFDISQNIGEKGKNCGWYGVRWSMMAHYFITAFRIECNLRHMDCLLLGFST